MSENLPPGIEMCSKIDLSLPEKLTFSQWEHVIDLFLSQHQLLHMSRDTKAEMRHMLLTGLIALSPTMLPFHCTSMYSGVKMHPDEDIRKQYNFTLNATNSFRGCHCAYVKAPYLCETNIAWMESLLIRGVRSFSFYANTLSKPFSFFYDKIDNVVEKLKYNDQMNNISPCVTLWSELHSKRTLEFLAAVSDADSLQFKEYLGPVDFRLREKQLLKRRRVEKLNECKGDTQPHKNINDSKPFTEKETIVNQVQLVTRPSSVENVRTSSSKTIYTERKTPEEGKKEKSKKPAPPLKHTDSSPTQTSHQYRILDDAQQVLVHRDIYRQQEKRDEHVVKEDEDDFSQKQHSATIRTTKARKTFGVYVPKLLFQLVAKNGDWIFHERKASESLSLVHNDDYNELYENLGRTAEGTVLVPAKKVLSMLIRAAVSNEIKFVVLLRDSCHSIKASHSGATAIWNEDIQRNGAPVFPNHMAEVPIVCNADITLQFAAFLNIKEIVANKENSERCVKLAYTLLQAVLERHVPLAKEYAERNYNNHEINDIETSNHALLNRHIFSGQQISLSCAVGVIGLHDAVNVCFDHRNTKTGAHGDGEIYTGMRSRTNANVFNLVDFNDDKQRTQVNSFSTKETHDDLKGMKPGKMQIDNGNLLDYNICEYNDKMPLRMVTSSDIERHVVPLIKTANYVFPMTGFLASTLWGVTPGCWTCNVLYWKITLNDGSFLLIPSGPFSQFCARNAVSLDHTESVLSASAKFNEITSKSFHNTQLLFSRIDSQVCQLRKICSVFFTATSMPLVITLEDANRFRDPTALLLHLTEIVIKNANNDCPVLLPEVRTTELDFQRARISANKSVASACARSKDIGNNNSMDNGTQSRKTRSFGKFIYDCITRRSAYKAITSPNAIDALEKFLDFTVDQLNSLRNISSSDGISGFALNFLETLISQKVEEVT